MYYYILPETLKVLRNRLRLSQAALAARAGIDRQTIIAIEVHGGPRRTRDFIAKELAKHLKVEISDLERPIPEEMFLTDIDVFSHFRSVLRRKDFYHSMEIFKYIKYHLAEALDIAQLSLEPGWEEEALNGPRPTLPSVPLGPPSISHGPIDEQVWGDLLTVWYRLIGDHAVNPDEMCRDPDFSELHEVIKMLPVVDRGRINSFWLKACFRRMSGIECGEFILQRFLSLSSELWHVVKIDSEYRLNGPAFPA